MGSNTAYKLCPKCGKKRRFWRRFEARQKGWTKVDGKWVCYVCSEPAGMDSNHRPPGTLGALTN